jgi:hypothetical protein
MSIFSNVPRSVDDAVAGLVAAAGRLAIVIEQQQQEISRQADIKSKANEAITKHTIEVTRAKRIAAKLSEIIE